MGAREAEVDRKEELWGRKRCVNLRSFNLCFFGLPARPLMCNEMMAVMSAGRVLKGALTAYDPQARKGKPSPRLPNWEECFHYYVNSISPLIAIL